VLYTQLGATQRSNYHKSIQLLDARRIPYEGIDGSDPQHKIRCVGVGLRVSATSLAFLGRVTEKL
jgi:hypothetical protein